MTATKPVRSISATCACGATFSREIKRGRPQVWCPSCLLVPFYERTAERTAPVVVADVAVEAAPERISNENDVLDHVRVDIEAGMALINMDHKVRFANLLATGVNVFDVATKVQADTLAATQNLYATLAPGKYKPGRDAEDV